MSVVSTRTLAVVLLSLIVLAPTVMTAVKVTGEGAVRSPDDTPSRSGDQIIQAGINVEGYQTDKLWAMAFVQNQDYIEGHSATPGDTDYYRFREVANSFALKLDGTVQGSGDVKRSLVELFTATDCVYCPGAEESLNVTVNDIFPDQMTLIEWHRALEPGADPFETGSSGNRFNLYNISGTPMVIFDGQLGIVGGAASARPPQFVDAYKEAVNIMNREEPMVSFSGSGKVTGSTLDLTISFEQTAPMPRGNWSYSIIICEDLQRLHNGAMLRHTQRLSYGKTLPLLQVDHPTMDLDVEGTFAGIDRERVRENITLKWKAHDPEDGDAVLIDIQVRGPEGNWQTVASSLSNTGSHTWDTMRPRWPDGEYQLRLVASDTDGNQVRSTEMPLFRLDNMDVPSGSLIFPLGGESLHGLQQVRWSSSDDEDDLLRAKVSISNDTGLTWRTLTYDPDHDDHEVDMGSFALNTLFYDDVPTYMLEVDIRDSDGMGITLRSGTFEIYNNDVPSVTLISPGVRELFTGSIVVTFRAEDQEDGPEDMDCLITVSKKGGGGPYILKEGPLNASYDTVHFPTSLLGGDGDYLMSFNITDSRGLKASDQVEFTVYDPDAPVVTGLRARINLTPLRAPYIPLEWSAQDADKGEQLTFTIYGGNGPVPGNWSMMVSDVKGTSYNLSIEGWEEGTGWLKVEAKDSSSFGLTGNVTLGPITYDPHDPPEVTFVFPEPGFTGTIEGTIEGDLSKGAFVRRVAWTGHDRDGDELTYGLYCKCGSDPSWKPLITQTDLDSYDWNMTALKNGTYQLRLIVVDSSVKHLTGEAVVGPFSVRNPFDVPPVQDDDDDVEPDDDTDDDGSDTLLMVGLIAGSILVVIVITIAVLYLVFRPQKKDYKVVPDEGALDLEIPDIERNTPQPMVGYAMTQQGIVMEELPASPLPSPPQPPQAPEIGGSLPGPSPASQTPAMLTGSVSWEDSPADPPPEEVRSPEADEGKATQDVPGDIATANP